MTDTRDKLAEAHRAIRAHGQGGVMDANITGQYAAWVRNSLQFLMDQSRKECRRARTRFATDDPWSQASMAIAAAHEEAAEVYRRRILELDAARTGKEE